MATQEQIAIAELATKMDYVVKSIDEMKAYVVHKSTHEALERRVEKLENASMKWIPIVISIISAATAIVSIIYK